jgi:hypothetical protein
MAIRFQCACGRWLNVDDDLAGRRVACSKCGAQSQVPAAAPLSAPEALAAAMREATQTAEEDLPTAEVLDEPPEAAPPTDGLEALAHVVKSATPPKPGLRGPQPKARGRRPAGPAARSPLQAGRKGAPAAQRMSPALIGVISGAAAVLLLIVILALFGGGGDPPKKETPPPPPPPVVEAPKPKRYTGHQPGEMFRQVPFDDEKQAPQGQPPAKKP